MITPNGDGFNDFFTLTGEDIPYPQQLPEDNCRSSFEEVIIFNRWGRIVFRDTRREFRWNAKNEVAGVYYYQIKFSDFEYKGTLFVLY